MNKKKAVAPPVPAVGDVSEVAADELSVLIDDMSIESKLKEWAARENPECLTVRTYIYKYDNPTTGDNKVLCDRVDEDIPDPHQVGMMYGSGRYMMIVAIPDGTQQQKKVKGLRFRLHARYDELRKNAGSVVSMGAPPAAVPVPVNSMRDGLEMVKAVVEILRPMIDNRPAAAVSAGPDITKILESNYEMMAGMMRRSLTDSQQMIQEVHKAKLESGGDPVNDEPDFLARVMPLVQQFLPLILGGGGTAATTAAIVRSIPEVKKVIGDRGELVRVVSWLDKSQGKEKTDRILAALRVRRPGGNGKLRPGVQRVNSVGAVPAVVPGGK